MSKRIYNKHNYPSTIRSGITSREDTRQRIYAQRRARMMVVPGYTRTAGAYKRSNPRNFEETHYNDCTTQTDVPTTGVAVPWTCVSPSAAAPANPNTTSLVAISQGTTKNQRIGNKLHVYAIRIKGQMILPSCTTSDIVRVLLVLDTQANGAAATLNQVLEGNGGGGAATDNDFANMDNIDRFKIVKDKYITMNPSVGVSGTSNTTYQKEFKMNHKCKTRIDYSSTTGAITELKSMNWMLFAISETGEGVISVTSRVYWKE